MSTPHDAFQAANHHHQAGRLHEATYYYQQALKENPLHADALHMFGVLCFQMRQTTAATQCLERAIAVEGGRAAYHSALGDAYLAAERFDDARQAFARAVELDPASVAPWYGLAVVSRVQGDPAAAVAHCRRALQLQDNHADALRLLATTLAAQGDRAAADDCYERLLRLSPADIPLLWQRGTLAREMGRYDVARQCMRQAIQLQPHTAELYLGLGDVEAAARQWPAAINAYQAGVERKPDLPQAHGQLGTALQASGQLEQAVEHYRRAIGLNPNYTTAHYNLGTALESLKRPDEAAACYQAALQIDRKYVDAWINLGSYYQMLPDHAQALACYERALALKPDAPKARFNRGIIWLNEGRYAQAWPEYEWRAKIADFPVHKFDLPRWNGEEIAGKTLLVHAEQGMGDALQFVRYLPEVRRRCGRMMLLVHPPLVTFLKQAGFDDLFDDERALPPADFQIALMSLPGLFGTTLETIPSAESYLSIQADLVDAWRERLAGIDGFRVGVCWQGNLTHKADSRRSFPLTALAPLAKVPGVRLISLQKNVGVEQLDALAGRFDVVDLRPDYDVEAGAFLNAAAVIKNLDLVVTADTAIGHLAGALGAPVWVALSQLGDWRWRPAGDRTAWYPSMRLFRQASPGDWPELFERMAGELRALVERNANGATGGG